MAGVGLVAGGSACEGGAEIENGEGLVKVDASSGVNEEQLNRPLISQGSSSLTTSYADFPRGTLGEVQKAKDTSEETTRVVKRKLILALSLSFAFMLIELVGGALAHSLAIMTDAAHMLSDSTSFFISFMAVMVRLSINKDKTQTTGRQRNSCLLSLFVGFL